MTTDETRNDLFHIGIPCRNANARIFYSHLFYLLATDNVVTGKQNSFAIKSLE